MQEQPKTSFIPKKPLQTAPTAKVAMPSQKGSGGKKLFSLIATIIFIAVVVAFGAVISYKFTLQKRIEDQIDSLRRTKDEFDENFIQDATRLNLRINSATKLLDNHLSPSSIFALLEEYTLQTVSFENFMFQDLKDGNIQVTGTGEAARFESIVLQSDSFDQSGFMRNVLFNNLQPIIDRGTISFSFSATLDPRLILYRNSLPDNFGNVNPDEN
jgi:hypothetical protein